MFLVKYKLGLQDRCNQNKFWYFIIKKNFNIVKIKMKNKHTNFEPLSSQFHLLKRSKNDSLTFPEYGFNLCSNKYFNS